MLNQKVRYGLVRRLLRRQRGGAICEVGSGRTGLSGYFPGIPFVGVDLDFDDYGGPRVAFAEEMRPLRADARRMPFADRTFDLVFSLDMIEHVPAAWRSDVIQELARITRGDLVVAFPCGQEARDADHRLAAALAAKGRPVPRWLAEHAEVDYPMPGVMDDVFTALELPFDVHLNESLALRRFVEIAEWTGLPGRLMDRWLPFACLDLIDALGRQRTRTRRVYHVRAS